MVHERPAASSAVSYGQRAKNTGSEVPDVFCAVFEYPAFMATWTLNYCNSFDNGWSIQFQGDQGTLIIDEHGLRVWREPWAKNPEPVQKLEAPVPIESHIQNFLDCVKSRRQPVSDLESGHRVATACHLANISLRLGRKLRWDAGREEIVGELLFFMGETVRELGEHRASGFLKKFYGWYLGRGRFPRPFKQELVQLRTVAEAERRLLAAAPDAAAVLERLRDEASGIDETLLQLPISVYGGG